MRKILLTLCGLTTTLGSTLSVVSCAQKDEENNAVDDYEWPPMPEPTVPLPPTIEVPEGPHVDVDEPVEMNRPLISSGGLWNDFVFDYEFSGLPGESSILIITGDIGQQFEGMTMWYEYELARMHLMNQLIEIIRNSEGRDVTRINLNNKRLYLEYHDYDSIRWGNSLSSIVADGQVYNYQDLKEDLAISGTFIKNYVGDDALPLLTPFTSLLSNLIGFEFLTACGIYPAYLNFDETTYNYGGWVNGRKLEINGKYLGFVEDYDADFSSMNDGFFFASLANQFMRMIKTIDTEELERITTLVINYDDTKKEIEIGGILGYDNLAMIIEDYSLTETPSTSKVDATSSEYDFYFDLLDRIQITLLPGFITVPRDHYFYKTPMIKAELLLLRLLMQYYE